MTEGFIYAISRKATAKIIYIGQTRQSPAARWSQHKDRKTPLAVALRAEGLGCFAFTVIETVPVEQLNEREIFWISNHNTMHPNGLNHRPGGRAKGTTKALKAKMSAINLEVWNTPGYKEKQSERRKITWQDPEYRAKMAASRKAMWEDPEFRERMSAKRRELMADPKRKAQQIDATRRFWADPENKQKTSAAISKAHKELSEDPQHVAALTAKIKKRWAVNAFL